MVLLMPDAETAIQFENSTHGFQGFLVIDSTVLGPESGSIIILPDVCEAEIRILARAKTCKNAFYNLPAGGAKAGIVCDPQSSLRAQTILPSHLRCLRSQVSRGIG